MRKFLALFFAAVCVSAACAQSPLEGKRIRSEEHTSELQSQR